MARVKGGAATRHRRNAMLKKAKGFWGSRSTNFKMAKQFVIAGGVYAFAHRRAKKRDFRSLWIVRVTAACEARGISYSRFMGGMRKANIDLNRKMLSEIAIFDPTAFDLIVEKAKAAFAKEVAA